MDADVASAGLHPGGLAALGTRGKGPREREGLVLPGAALLPSDKNHKTNQTQKCHPIWSGILQYLNGN